MRGGLGLDGQGPCGLIVHAWSGWYEVATDDGRPLLCRPRGRLRGRSKGWRDRRDTDRAAAGLWSDEDELEAGTLLGSGTRAGAIRHAQPGAASEGEPTAPALLAGDRVRFEDLGGGEGRIESVEPRRTVLVRPPVANVDLVLVVVAWDAPPWHPGLIDRTLVEVARAGCAVALCLNKCDRLDDGAMADARAALSPYRDAGYPVLLASAIRGEGLDGIRHLLSGRVAALAGPSGAGKSRLLAALAPGGDVGPSGSLSPRLRHGRHTTRSVRLLPLGGAGWVADTPGFSRLDLAGMEPEELAGWYPEFTAPAEGCRFRGCLHADEPACAVRAAASQGGVDAGRYARYRELLEELRAAPPRW